MEFKNLNNNQISIKEIMYQRYLNVINESINYINSNILNEFQFEPIKIDSWVGRNVFGSPVVYNTDDISNDYDKNLLLYAQKFYNNKNMTMDDLEDMDPSKFANVKQSYDNAADNAASKIGKANFGIKLGIGAAGISAAYAAGKFGWNKWNESQLNKIANDIMNLDPNSDNYKGLITNYSSNITPEVIDKFKELGILNNPNIKDVCLATGMNLEDVYPDYYDSLQDEGFLSKLGDKGNQLYNFLTSGSTTGNIAAGALAAAGLAGLYYLYKKWKDNGTVTNNDKGVAEIIDQNSSKNLNESYEAQNDVDKANWGRIYNRMGNAFYMTNPTLFGITTGGAVGGPVGAMVGGAAGAGIGYLNYKIPQWLQDIKSNSILNTYGNLLDRVTNISINDPRYDEKISQCIEDLHYLKEKGYQNDLGIKGIVALKDLAQHPNVKRLLIKGGIDVTGLYPENEINDIMVEDKGFLAQLGNKGNQLWNFLTSGSTAGNITAAALAAAGLYGAYYLYKKWKQNKKIDEDDKAIAEIIDQNSSKKKI